MPAASDDIEMQAEGLLGASNIALRTDGAELYPDQRFSI
jgi:hypothetical protein